MKRAILSAVVLVAVLMTVGCKSSGTSTVLNDRSFRDGDLVVRLYDVDDLIKRDVESGSSSSKAAEKLADLLADVVGSEVYWQKAGGRQTITFYQDTMIVRATEKQQDELEALLDGLRGIALDRADRDAHTNWGRLTDAVDFNNVPLSKAIEELKSRAAPAEVHVYWDSLGTVGIEPHLQMSLRMKEGVPVSTVLALLMRQLREFDPKNPPASRIIEGVMVIGLESDIRAAMAQAYGDDPEKQWNAPTPQVNFENTTADAAFRYLEAASLGGTMEVRWESLERVGLERDTQVTLQLPPRTPVSQVLALIMRQFTALDPYNPPECHIVDGVMVIALKQDFGA